MRFLGSKPHVLVVFSGRRWPVFIDKEIHSVVDSLLIKKIIIKGMIF